MLRTTALFCFAVLLAAACGKDSSGPTPPPAGDVRWTSISLYVCPADAQNTSQCTTEVAGDTLLANRYHVNRHLSPNAAYLRGALSWAADSAGCGQAALESGRCVYRGAFPFAQGKVDLVLSLAAGATYQLDWSLAAGANSPSLADTSFTYVVPAAPAATGAAANRAPAPQSPGISLPW